MNRLVTGFAVPAALLLAAAIVQAAEPHITSQPGIFYGSSAAKASADTVDLMGPGGRYPYRGDFETAAARPGGEGLLPDGWTSVDLTAPPNHWQVSTYRNPFSGKAAWCGSLEFASCGGSDPAGGYGNDWYDVLEFRKTVGPGPATVRVRASLQYDTEPAYDYVYLARRTAAGTGFEAVTGGQGLSWDGTGTATVDYTFNWTEAELVAGTDVAIAFVFDADSGWSDGDCLWPTDGAARVDDITVTVNGTDYVEDFEDGLPGPDWKFTPNFVAGDFARIWQKLGDLDDCASNYSKLLAFIDDGLVVPGTGGSFGQPGTDYGPGGHVVSYTGGLRGAYADWSNRVLSPVMELPVGQPSGLTVAFDVYVHATREPGWADLFYTWYVRSTAGGDITTAPWLHRKLIYYGGPAYIRTINVVDDLLVPGATAVQVAFDVMDLTHMLCYFCTSENASPAPYFDNVSVKAYPSTGGPHLVVTELRLANDGFPASGAIDPVNLGANSVRFDMAANISWRSHLRNDPGDSICIDVTPRSGGTLSAPIMHWKFAAKNPLFTDAHRTALAPGQVVGAVTGRVTRTATGAIVKNRFNFDLPDTGMLFPGDVLHYYFAATDVVAGDARTSYAPPDLSGFGDPRPQAYPGLYTVNCLPSLRDAQGSQPGLLFWNDFGFSGGEDEWYGALVTSLGLEKGVDFDVFNTHAPSSGMGNGLGGRATVGQVAGYADLLYSCGDLGSHTLSNGDYTGDPSNDIGLLDAWLALGDRNLFLTGDDLAESLYGGGLASRAFLTYRLGVDYIDGDVRDNIGGQPSPLVVPVAGNPVLSAVGPWVAYGGCPNPNDFDHITPRAGAVRLAEFTAPGGGAGAYSAAAAVLNLDGSNRVITMDHDLSFVIDPVGKDAAPFARRAALLLDVLDYFGIPQSPGIGTDVPGATAPFTVRSYPNPFNPSVTLRYTLVRPGSVTMKVYDARGTLVRTLLDGPVAQADGFVTWDGTDGRGSGVSSGLYFVETRAEGQVDVRKVTMLK